MAGTDDAIYPVNIVCVNADVLPQWANEAGADFFADRYTVGLWWWEVTAFPPDWLRSFDFVDEIWVATQPIADALTPIATVPVHKITLPIPPRNPPALGRRELKLPDGFLFMFMFDYHSVFERKNPLALIDAFARAFEPGSGAKLVIKSINHRHYPDAHDRLVLAAARHPDIELRNDYVSGDERDAMVAACDCYVSLHRAEGFGLTPAEAMSAGRPVIATRYGGNLEFMTDDNSRLVDYTLVPIGPGNAPYPAGGTWAQPDVEQAAGFMREVFDNPQQARTRADRAVRDLRSGFSAEAAGVSVKARLDGIRARRARWPAHQPAVASPNVDLTRLQGLVNLGPQAPPRSPLGPVGRVARRTMLRLSRPVTAHQRTLDQEVLAQLNALALTQKEQRRNRIRDAEALVGLMAELRRRETQAGPTAPPPGGAIQPLHAPAPRSAAGVSQAGDPAPLAPAGPADPAAAPAANGATQHASDPAAARP